MQINVGTAIDTDGFAFEVWVEYFEDSPTHVYLMYGGSQQGDFPYSQPGNNPLHIVAQRVARGEAKQLAVMSEGEVIDRDDTANMLRDWQTTGRMN
jgi:hypothetical protein